MAGGETSGVRLRVRLPSGQSYDWSNTAPVLRIGRLESCSLRFADEAADQVSREHAEMPLLNGGWQVADLGSTNGTFLDGVQLEPKMPRPLRVGSVVQMGRTGPRLEVVELATATTPFTSQSPVANGQSVARPSSRPRTTRIVLATAVAAVLFVAVAVGLAYQSRSKQVAEPPQETPSNASRSDVAAMASSASAAPSTQVQEPTVNNSPAAPKKAAVAAPQQKPVERALAAVQLVVVRDPETDTEWPFATAAVIDPRAVLTTATVAIELEKLRSETKLQVILRRNLEQQPIVVNEIRVHAAFQEESAERQPYFNLGLLHTSEALSHVLPLASAADLKQLERGLPLTCIAINHNAPEALDRFQQLDPQSYGVKLLAETQFEPGSPKLIHVRGSITEKAEGSPIVNNEGRLVAVYEQRDPTGPQGADAIEIHSAKVIEADLVALGMSNKDDTIWSRPKMPPSNPGTVSSGQPPSESQP